MISFEKLEQKQLREGIHLRAGETKLGETLNANPHAKYQIIGIPESLGVRANYGLGGTETAWPAFLKAFVNLQDNRYLKGEEIYIAGEFKVHFPPTTEIALLRQHVEELDRAVSTKVEEVVRAGQIPLLIGGGHNNAFPILKGCSQALGRPLNVINLDAHADYRPLEGRHSGNGFSYAAHFGYLNQYTVLGLKRAYASENMLLAMEKAGVQVFFMDELQRDAEREQALKKALEMGEPLGLEIDLDSLENVLSSAVNPWGFPLKMAHHVLQYTAPSLRYLHLCEGAARLDDGRTYPGIGKVLAELLATYLFTVGLPVPNGETGISQTGHSSRK